MLRIFYFYASLAVVVGWVDAMNFTYTAMDAQQKKQWKKVSLQYDCLLPTNDDEISCSALLNEVRRVESLQSSEKLLPTIIREGVIFKKRECLIRIKKAYEYLMRTEKVQRSSRSDMETLAVKLKEMRVID